MLIICLHILEIEPHHRTQFYVTGGSLIFCRGCRADIEPQRIYIHKERKRYCDDHFGGRFNFDRRCKKKSVTFSSV